MGLSGPKWTELDQTRPNWNKMDQGGQEMDRIELKGPNQTKQKEMN